MCEIPIAGYVLGLVLTMLAAAPIGALSFISTTALFACSVCGFSIVLAPDQETMLTLTGCAAFIAAGLASGSFAITAFITAVTVATSALIR